MPQSRHLTERERARLKRTLHQIERSMSYEWARGAFAAFATMPGRLAPSRWFELVLGPTSLFESVDELREVNDKLVKLCCEVMDHMGHATHSVCADPSDVDAVRDWTYGYLSAAALHESFEDDFTGPALAALHILCNPALSPGIGAEKLRVLRVELPDVVTALYLYFRPVRNASTPREQRLRGLSIVPHQCAATGLHELCPCGSGKQFVRCCAV